MPGCRFNFFVNGIHNYPTMMIRKMLLAAACCLPLCGFAQKGFTIHGNAPGVNAPAKAVLIYSDAGKIVKDSTVIRNGKFSFSGQVKYPQESYLYILRDPNAQYSQSGVHGNAPRQDVDHLDFYVDNSDMKITVKDTVALANVEGSALNNELKVFKAMNKPNNMLLDSIKMMAKSATPENKKDVNWQNQYKARLDKFQHMLSSVDKTWMTDYPNSFITLLLFRQLNFAYNFNPDTVAARFAKLPQQQRESAFGKELEATINSAKNTGIGRTALDFTENDPAGKKVSLSDFRGHYVLLDFWASWCAPCRAENPNYLKAYNQYKDKNFTILGVSIDKEDAKAAWLAAIKKDNLPWTQISDLKGSNNKAAELYGVNAIPTNYLIDPDGKIVAKNLRGEALLQKLASILK